MTMVAHTVCVVIEFRKAVYDAAAGCAAMSVAIVALEVTLTRIALLALMANRCGNRRDPDFAVTGVEARVLAGGVLLLLRCFHIHSPELQSFLALSPSNPMWRITGAELRGKSCGLVTFDGCRRR